MTGAWRTLNVRQEDGVAQVVLERPDRLNALSQQIREELAALWHELAADRTVRCVVLTGAGRAFSAGADMGDLSQRPGDGSGAKVEYLPATWLRVPVIVAVNGLCLGGALRFVADADIVLAAEDAWFSDPHVSLGQPSGPCVLELAARSSAAAVAPLVLAGREYRLSAAQAQALGLVSEVLPAKQLVPRAVELAGMIARQSPTAVRATLYLLRQRTDEPVRDLMPGAWAMVEWMRQHPDSTEGPAAFAARRPPVWADPADLHTHPALDGTGDNR